MILWLIVQVFHHLMRLNNKCLFLKGITALNPGADTIVANHKDYQILLFVPYSNMDKYSKVVGGKLSGYGEGFIKELSESLKDLFNNYNGSSVDTKPVASSNNE